MKIVFIYWERNNDGHADYKKAHTFEIDITNKNATDVMREYSDIVNNINPFIYTSPEFCGII